MIMNLCFARVRAGRVVPRDYVIVERDLWMVEGVSPTRVKGSPKGLVMLALGGVTRSNYGTSKGVLRNADLIMEVYTPSLFANSYTPMCEFDVMTHIPTEGLRQTLDIPPIDYDEEEDWW
jgi:hypothetical protein